jgi:hypothetical protein
LISTSLMTFWLLFCSSSRTKITWILSRLLNLRDFIAASSHRLPWLQSGILRVLQGFKIF